MTFNQYSFWSLIKNKLYVIVGTHSGKSTDLVSIGDSLKGRQGSQTKRSCIAKSSTSNKTSVTSASNNSGGKIRLRDRRSNGTIKASQNPNRASYPSALLPTVTENRSFDNRGQYNTQSQQRSQALNKQDSDTNLSIGLNGGNGVVSGVSAITTSRNNSTERLSGTDGELQYLINYFNVI